MSLFLNRGNFFQYHFFITFWFHSRFFGFSYYTSQKTEVKITNQERKVFRNFYLYPLTSDVNPEKLTEKFVGVDQPLKYRASLDPDEFIDSFSKKLAVFNLVTALICDK